MDNPQYLTLHLTRVGDDHIALIRNGTGEDIAAVNAWMRSMRSSQLTTPQVFAVHPSDARPTPNAKPAPQPVAHRDHPAFHREPPELTMKPASALAEATK